MDLIYTYAIMKTYHDEIGMDYIDSFRPILIGILKSNGNKSLNEIQLEIQGKYSFALPQHVLQILIDRLVKEDIIERRNKIYGLSDKGKNYDLKIMDEKVILDDVRLLISDIKEYIKNESSEDIPFEQINDILMLFINKNLDPMLGYIRGKGFKDEMKIKMENNFNKYEKMICEYVHKLEEESTQYKIFRDIILGAVINLSFNINSLSQPEKKFEAIEVFLDTNILFSVLNLHYPEFNEPTKELVQMLQSELFKLKIFDFTVKEAENYLNNCSEYPPKYIKKIKVNSVCANLKLEKNMNSWEIKNLTFNIKSKLKDYNIELMTTEVNPFSGSYRPRNKKLISKLREFKPNQPPNAANHDIAAIEMIKKIRGNSKFNNIETSKAIFLTADGFLSEFNSIEHNNTIPEVIVDRFLTCIVWLKNPSINIPLESLIANCCRDCFINKHLWERFLNNVDDLKRSELLKSDDFSALIYYGLAENILRKYNDERDVDKLTPEQTLIEINRELETFQTDSVKSKSLIEDLKKEKEKNIRKFIEDYLRIIRYVIALVLIIISIYIYYIKSNILIAISLVLISLILYGIGPSKKIWDIIGNKLYIRAISGQ
jgi:hypothetical protein